MSRRHLLTYIDDYLDGTLRAEERAVIEKYIEENPEEGAFIEKERTLREYLGEIETPDPGEPYWSDLESRIISMTEARDHQTVGREKRGESANIAAIGRYLVPLAAVLLLFFGSIGLSGLPSAPKMELAAGSSVEVKSDRSIDYYDKFALEFELVGSTVLGPPGTLGRKIVMMGIIDGFN